MGNPKLLTYFSASPSSMLPFSYNNFCRNSQVASKGHFEAFMTDKILTNETGMTIRGVMEHKKIFLYI